MDAPKRPSTQRRPYRERLNAHALRLGRRVAVHLSLTPMARIHLESLRSWPAETLGRLRPAADLKLPAWGQHLVGGGDALELTSLYRESLISAAGVRPHDDILDLGCGVGRFALAVSDYIQPPGSYTGLDVFRPAIRWCRNNITRRSAHFRFIHLDVVNTMYNPRGGTLAANAVLPFPSESFDCVIALSLFTHMTQPGLTQYLHETWRVLRPGGCLYATFFLLDDSTLELIDRQGHPFGFQHSAGISRISDPDIPDAIVAYSSDSLVSLITSTGLGVRQILWGSWSGREGDIYGQDVVIASLPHTP